MTISPYYSLSDRSSPGESVLSLRPGGGRGCGDGQRAELLGELAGGRDWLVTGSASSLGLPSCVRSLFLSLTRGPTPNALRSKNDVLLGGQSQPWPLDWSVSQRVGFEMF